MTDPDESGLSRAPDMPRWASELSNTFQLELSRPQVGFSPGAGAPRSKGFVTTLAKLGKRSNVDIVLVHVGQAKTDRSKLMARVEAGEAVEIARNGVPVARLVRIEPSPSAGTRFLAARGSLIGRISLADDFEFTDAEVDDMLDEAT